MSALFPTALVLLWLGQSVYGGVFAPETYPSLNSSSCGDTTPLYFGLIMSFDSGQFDGSGSIPGVKVALDRINSDCSILPGYSLHYTLADSRCNRTGALDALFGDTLLSGPTKLAVIGSGCSLATEPTAEVSHYYNFTQLSCVSSSPTLRDRTRFHSYFQLLSSEDSLALAYYGVIREYGWSHVSLIVQNENLFTETINRLTALLRMNNVTYDLKLFSSRESIAGLRDQPFNIDRRIHLIACYEGHARQLLCEAYKREIRLPRHLLLTPAWYERNWWRLDDVNFNYTCTGDERESVLDGSLAFLHFNFLNKSNPNVTTQDGLTGEQYFSLEDDFLGTPPLNFTFFEYAQYCYDATWSLAYALNNTIREIQNSTLNMGLRNAYGLDGNDLQFGLEDFSYKSSALRDIVFKNLEHTAFDGLTGRVGFSDQGTRAINVLRIYQFRDVINATGNIDWVEVGIVTGNPGNDSSYVFQYLDGETENKIWPNGIPYDGVPNIQTVTVEVAVTVVYAILITAGIVFAGGCLIFNFIFKDKKLIKLTSPNLNYMIGAGAIILYFNLYLFVIPTIDQTAISVLCNLTPWLTAVGYSLCYGTIVAKMMRVYYIFNNPSTKKNYTVKDWILVLVVLCLVAIDVIILFVYTAVEGSKTYTDGHNGLTARLDINQEIPQSISKESGKITNNFAFICTSKARDIFLGVLYGYKALLQIIALVLSFSIRKVKVRGLDDSKYVAASIYVSSIVFAVIIVSTYTLKDYINIFPIVFCTGFLIGTTVILCLVFIPLMVGLYKDPKGETIFDKSNKTSTSNNNNLQMHSMEGLRKRVIELEGIITTSHGNKKPGVNHLSVPTDVSMGSISPYVSAHKTENELARKKLEEIMGVTSERSQGPSIWDNGSST